MQCAKAVGMTEWDCCSENEDEDAGSEGPAGSMH